MPGFFIFVKKSFNVFKHQCYSIQLYAKVASINIINYLLCVCTFSIEKHNTYACTITWYYINYIKLGASLPAWEPFLSENNQACEIFAPKEPIFVRFWGMRQGQLLPILSEKNQASGLKFWNFVRIWGRPLRGIFGGPVTLASKSSSVPSRQLSPFPALHHLC